MEKILLKSDQANTRNLQSVLFKPKIPESEQFYFFKGKREAFEKSEL